MMERLFTAYQVADLLGRPRHDVQGWIESGDLASHRLADGTVRISEKHLVRFLRRQGVDIEALMAQTLQAQGQDTAADERARLLSSDPPALLDPPAEPPPPTPEIATDNDAEPPQPAAATDSDTVGSQPEPTIDGDAVQPRVAMAAHVVAALEADPSASPETPADLGGSKRSNNPYQSFTETINGSATPADTEPTETDEAPEPMASSDQPAAEEMPLPEAAPKSAEAPPAEQPSDDEGETAPEPAPEGAVEESTPPAVEPAETDEAPEPEPAAAPDEPSIEDTSAPKAAPDPVAAPPAEQPPDDEDEPASEEAPDEEDEPEAEEAPAADRPVVKVGGDSQAGQIVLAILTDAVKRHATAIRLEARGDQVTLRMRLGGVIEERESFRRHLPAGAGPKVIDELMALAGLDPMASGPQLGRVETLVGRREIALTVSALPTVGGQEIVVHLDNPAAAKKGLTALGMTRKDAHAIEDLLDRRAGLIVVAAPPRHGRASTLRAMAAHLADGRRGVLTVERSAGPEIDNAAQCRCGGRGGMAWDEALWAAADHDCDVVAVEDLCDPAAAVAAVEGALGGMTVLAGMCAASPVEAVRLLVRMGAGPWPLAATLQGVIAQRVVPALCADCRTPAKPAKKDLSALGLKARDVDFETFAPSGCDTCADTGYKGRTVLTSLLQIDDALADVIRDGADADALVAAAAQSETRDLLSAGLARARKGHLALADLAAAVVGGR